MLHSPSVLERTYCTVRRFIGACAAETVDSWEDVLHRPSVLGRMCYTVRRFLGGCAAQSVGSWKNVMHSPSVLGRMCCTVRRFLEECDALSIGYWEDVLQKKAKFVGLASSTASTIIAVVGQSVSRVAGINAHASRIIKGAQIWLNKSYFQLIHLRRNQEF